MNMQQPLTFNTTGSTGDDRSLGDYLSVLSTRRRVALRVFLLVTVASAVVIALLPAVYRSSGTILIEQQEIPADYVRSSVTTYADQRIQTISARVMTTANLLAVIRKYGLYAEERETVAPELIVEKMRALIELDTISADVVDPRTGRPTAATIAFTIAFSSPSPEMAQRVANELASLFLNENLRTRRQMAVDTSDFLSGEGSRLEARIQDLEKALATFKQDNAGKLPELAQLNLTLLDRAERDLVEVDRAISTQRQNVSYLASELSGVPATLETRATGVRLSGEQVLPPAEQLRVLETRLASLSAVYSAEHPDLLRTRREVEALRRVTSSGADRSALGAELEQYRTELARARERYSPQHPDVVRLERAVSALGTLLESNRAMGTANAEATQNPAHVELRARLAMARTELSTLNAKRAELRARRDDIEARLAAAPGVEQQYRALLRNYENAVSRYQEVTAKRMEAQMAQSLESEQKGERFTLIEPPLLPESPSQPNRTALAALAVLLATALALASVALAEALDRSVRGARGVYDVLGEPPLAAIPRIVSPADRAATRRARVFGVAAATAGAAALAAVVHVHYLPLDVAWYALLNRIVG